MNESELEKELREKLASEDIDCVYAAKLIAPHLKLKGGPYKPLLALRLKYALAEKFILGPDRFEFPVWSWGYFIKCYLTDSNYRQQVREERKSNKEVGGTEDAKEKALVQMLSDAGVAMPQGRQAWSIANDIGLSLETFFPSHRHSSQHITNLVNRFDLKIEQRDYFPDKKSSDILEILEISFPKSSFERILRSAISNAGNYLADDGYIINPDFNEKAKTTLLKETYSRLEQGKRFDLLEIVNVGMDGQQRIYLRRLT